MNEDKTATAIRKQRRDEQSRIALVSVAGSAGGTRAMSEILAHLPADFSVPILYLEHLNGSRVSALRERGQSKAAPPGFIGSVP